MMKKRVRIILFVIFCFVLSVTCKLFAEENQFLPVSSHYQGQTSFNVDGLRGDIEFAVYDTGTYEDEFVGADGFENPGDGQYVYAYQIFCDSSNEDPFGYFSILGIGENAIADEDDIGSMFDLTGEDVAPTDEYFNDPLTEGIWEFNNGFLLSDAHSQLLVISSDNDWKIGSYEIRRPGNLSVPGDSEGGGQSSLYTVVNPEPATISLLCFGSLLILRKSKRYSR